MQNANPFRTVEEFAKDASAWLRTKHGLNNREIVELFKRVNAKPSEQEKARALGEARA